MTQDKVNTFGKLGRLIVKRKYSLIALWIIALAIVLPIALTAEGVNSLQMGASTDNNMESVKADDIISTQLSKMVANNSLIIVISTENASSLSTQQFIDQLSNEIKDNSSISGIENVTSIYSILVPALYETNQGIYFAYKNANLTYTLLYSVPTIYSKVWSGAFDQTLQTLVSGLSQTNQAVFQVLDNANLTYNMLYGIPAMYSTVWSTAYNQTHDTISCGLIQTNQGVCAALENANLTCNMLYGTPAIYLNAWIDAYSSTSNVNQSNQAAYLATNAILQLADPVAFAQYNGPLLDAFNNTWVQSFANPASALYSPLERATYASSQTNQLYINTFLAGNATNQAFVNALTSNFTLNDFLTNTQEQKNTALANFAIQTVTAASAGLSSTEFVTAAYNLGVNPNSTALNSLVEAIIDNPETYRMGTNFISTFNEVAFNQSAAILSQADPVSYTQYTEPLLNAFNATWSMSFLDPTMTLWTPIQRATAASTQTNQLYINKVLTDNSSKTFTTALTNVFTLQDFLINTPIQNNVKLQKFAIDFTVTSSGASNQFVNAAYNLGRTPETGSLVDQAKTIVWNGEVYQMDQDFIGMFNDISYNQTRTILRDSEAASFKNYTSHLLDLFDTSWVHSFSGSTHNVSANSRALVASESAISQFIGTYFNDEKDFANAVAETFSLQDFLDANTTSTNVKAQNLASSYIANESGLSPQLIDAIFNLGENATIDKVQTLVSNVVWSPQPYNVGSQFNELLGSFVSPSKDVSLISINLNQTSDNNILVIRDIISNRLLQHPEDIISVQVTGNDALNYDFSQSTQQDLEIILPITIALLVIATGLFFRSVITPIITLGTIGVGIGVSQIFPYLVGTYINQVDYTVTTVLLTVLIGVGTDYSIFIIARHREERINSLPLFEAIKKSIVWAGESIVTSGATVIISFLALATTSMVMLQTMGLVVGLGIIVTLLASLSFAPALAALLGDRIFWPNSGERFQRYAKGILEKNKRGKGYFVKSGTFSVKHGKKIILIALIVTLPAFYVYATTIPTYNLIGSASNSLESISASNVLIDSFGGSTLMPSYVVVTFSEPIVKNGVFNVGEMSTLQAVSDMIVSREGVSQVTGPTMPYGEMVDYQTVTNASHGTTYSSMLGYIGADNKSALISVKFHVDPYSTDAMNYAKEIRSTVHENYDSGANVTGIYLGGTTGSILDTRNAFENQFNSILPIVALGVGIVLFIVLGSLILPIFAVVSVLMSIVWTLAVTVIVFQSAFNYGLLFITPLVLFVLLLGLGMDYNIFILTRIREEASKGQHLNDAIVHAIQQTGGIITAAAVILAGSLGTLILSSNMMLKEMGFAFCFSILIDALVVRTYLVPAVMSTFGKLNWYNPIKRLRRLKEV
jgi:putative drug exporter of the RND superfamily